MAILDTHGQSNSHNEVKLFVMINHIASNMTA